MAHHAYFFAGEAGEGVTSALAFGERVLELSPVGNPDVIVERYGLFSVEDARMLAAKAALSPLIGQKKLLIVSVGRLFHEAQNALLKLFEEPPVHTTLVLIVPSEGTIIETLRSRLHPLPIIESIENDTKHKESSLAEQFIKGDAAVRERIIEKILEETKSDKDEEKQEGRVKALHFLEELTCSTYLAWQKNPEALAYQEFLQDLDHFVPMLHDRAAPLKPILEHVLITVPK
ncbi:MAG: hypothetical protein WAV21_01355 [Minisyncoccia bacterium]